MAGGCPSSSCPPGWTLGRGSPLWELGAGDQQRCLSRDFPPASAIEPQSWHLGDCRGRREQGRSFSAPNWPVSSHQDVLCGGWTLLLVMLGHQVGLRLATLGMSQGVPSTLRQHFPPQQPISPLLARREEHCSQQQVMRGL